MKGWGLKGSRPFCLWEMEDRRWEMGLFVNVNVNVKVNVNGS